MAIAARYPSTRVRSEVAGVDAGEAATRTRCKLRQRILYESYIHPITILSTLPSAGVGVVATLTLFHFSLIALIGIILLIGIVKKNGIMLVDFAIIAERDNQLSAHDAIRVPHSLRFRSDPS